LPDSGSAGNPGWQYSDNRLFLKQIPLQTLKVSRSWPLDNLRERKRRAERPEVTAMNVNAQFPQALPTTSYQRPLDKPVEQTTTRPVDNPKAAEAAANKPEQEAARAPVQPSGQESQQAPRTTHKAAAARREQTESEHGASDSEAAEASPQAKRIQAASHPATPIGDLLDVVA